jgi:hypothetical protein
MIRALPALAVLLLAAPAVAGEAPHAFGGFAETVVTGQFAMPEGDFRHVENPLIDSIRIGRQEIRLEQTTMAGIAEAFGGTIQETGEAGGHVVWLCLILPDGVLWFYSDGEVGQGKVNMVALEAGNPAPEWGCTAAMLDLTDINLGIASFGTPLTEITEEFGALVPDRDGRLGYILTSPHPERGGFSIYQGVTFRVTDGVVDAFAVDQQTAD